MMQRIREMSESPEVVFTVQRDILRGVKKKFPMVTGGKSVLEISWS